MTISDIRGYAKLLRLMLAEAPDDAHRDAFLAEALLIVHRAGADDALKTTSASSTSVKVLA